MKQDVFETIVGFIIIAIASYFIIFVYNTTSNNSDGYHIIGSFSNAEGINKGSNVMVAGIKVGEVVNMSLDSESYDALVTLKLNKTVKIPKDSQAAIVSNGFLGGKFIAITPGAVDQDLKNNERLQFTQPSLNLEGMIGKFMMNAFSNSNNKQ